MGTQQDRAAKLFDAIVELESAAERSAYLDAACSQDSQLRAEVEELLAHDNAAGSFLNVSSQPDPRATVDDPISERPGTVIGSYKLLEQIGEGSFGVVFMAEQQQPIRRKVALKILKPGMDTRQVVARFEAERQALAIMDHPHIAHVFDGGETVTGRPYFVMELVRGIPITDFCDQARLSIRERLQLFVDVCQAVQHAHQKGIIHRDIKPSNVMVTLHDGAPVVKVIDFGIAKATSQRLTDKTLFTNFAQMIGTPLYMSPEQAGMSGLDVDTRSDIYSLGVLLYELLTGTTPFDRKQLREASYDEIRRLICEEEPPKPSTRISTLGQAATTASTQRQSEPKRLSQLCRGELDWIVMKALEKDRSRRYETVNSFAMDVQRYLADEPVRACPPTVGYRLRKFARRNKGALASIGLIALALIAGAAISIRQAIRATNAESLAEQRLKDVEKEHKEALANLQKAREAGEEFFTLVSENRLLDQPGLQPLRKELLEAAVQYYEQLATGAGNDPRGQADVAVVSLRLAQIYFQTEFRDQHVSALKTSLGRAEKLVHDHPDSGELHLRLAGFWHGGRCLGVQQPIVDQRSALDVYQRAIRVWERLSQRHPTATGFQADLSKFYDLQANVQRELGQQEKALHSKQRVCEIREKIVRANPGVYEYVSELAFAYFSLAQDLEVGDPQAAEKLLLRAIALCKDAPDVVSYQEPLAGLQWYFADYLKRQKRPAEAAEHMQQAVSIFEKLAAKYPHMVYYGQQATAWRTQLHGLRADAFKHAAVLKAKGALQQALAEYSKVIELDPKNSTAWGNRGEIYRDLHQYDKALDAFSKAIDLDPKNAWLWGCQAYTHMKLREYDKALAEFTRAIELDPSYSTGWYLRAEIYMALGQKDKALGDYSKAIEICEKNVARYPDSPTCRLELARTHSMLAKTLSTSSQIKEAEKHYRQARDILKGLTTEFPAETAYVCELGHADRLLSIILPANRIQAKLSLYEEAADVFGKLGAANPNISDFLHFEADTHRRIGDVLSTMKRYDEAEKAYRKAVDLFQKLHAGKFRPGGYHNITEEAWGYTSLANFLIARNRSEDAATVLREAISDYSKAIELDPKYKDARIGRALIYAQLHEHDKALADYSKVIDLDPTNSSMIRDIARMEAQHGRWNEAINYFSKALQLNASDWGIWDDRGMAYMALHQYTKAVDDFTASLRLHSAAAWVWSHRGDAYRELGDLEKAIADYSKAIELDPKALSARYQRAGVNSQLGRYAEALADYQKILELAKDNVIAHNNLAWFLATCPDAKYRHPTRAVELAKKAVEQAPKEGNHWNTLGVAQYRCHDFQAAIAALQKSMNLRKGGDSFDWFFLAMAQWQLGNEKEARTWFDKAVAWQAKNQPNNEELRRFRDEAAKLLEVKEKK